MTECQRCWTQCLKMETEEDEKIFKKYYCPNCGNKWTEVYKICGVTFIQDNYQTFAENLIELVEVWPHH